MSILCIFSLGRKNRARSIGTKFPENSGTKSNGQNICGNSFRKYLTISLQRLFFFRKFGNSGNFLFYWALSLCFVLLKVFSPAILMFLRFTWHRKIFLTHFNVSDVTTRFVHFLGEKFLELVKWNVTQSYH